jgi:hypothetical protein
MPSSEGSIYRPLPSGSRGNQRSSQKSQDPLGSLSE